MVAIALLVIILLLIGIIFIPLTYEFRFSSRRPYLVDIHALWGFKKVIYLHFRYEQGQPFIKELILAGKDRLAPKDKPKDKEDSLDRIAKNKTTSKTQEDEKDILTTEAQQDNLASEQKKNLPASEKSKQEEKIDYMWWLPHVKKISLYQALLKFISRCYHHSKPRSFYLEGLFGTGDPCETGILAGLFYALCPERMEEVEFNFIEPSYGGSGYLKGKIVPAFLMWYGLCLICAKPIREFIWAAIKFIRLKRKQKSK